MSLFNDFKDRLLVGAQEAKTVFDSIDSKLETAAKSIDSTVENVSKSLNLATESTPAKTAPTLMPMNDDPVNTEKPCCETTQNESVVASASNLTNSVDGVKEDALTTPKEQEPSASLMDAVSSAQWMPPAQKEEAIKQEKNNGVPEQVKTAATEVKDKPMPAPQTQRPAKREYHDPEDRLHKFCIVKKTNKTEGGEIVAETFEVPSSVIAQLRWYYWSYGKTAVAGITDYAFSPEGGEIGIWVVYPNNDAEWIRHEIVCSKNGSPLVRIAPVSDVSVEQQKIIKDEIKKQYINDGVLRADIFHYGHTLENHSICGMITTKADRDHPQWFVADWENWNRPEEIPIIKIVSSSIFCALWNIDNDGISLPIRSSYYWAYLYSENLWELETLGAFDISHDMGFYDAEATRVAPENISGSIGEWQFKTDRAANCVTVAVKKMLSDERKAALRRKWNYFEIPDSKIEPLYIERKEVLRKKKEAEDARTAAEKAQKAAEQAEAQRKREEEEKREEEARQKREAERDEWRRKDYEWKKSQLELLQNSELQQVATSKENKGRETRTRIANLYVSGAPKRVLQYRDSLLVPEGKVPGKSPLIKNPPKWSADRKITVRKPQKGDFVYAHYKETYGNGNAKFYVFAGNVKKYDVIVYANSDRGKETFADCSAESCCWIKIIDVRNNSKIKYFGIRTYGNLSQEISVFKNGYAPKDYVFAPISKDDSGKAFAWFGPHLRCSIEDEDVAAELASREPGDFGQDNYVFQIKSIRQSQTTRDEISVDLKYIADANTKSFATEATYANWNRIPDPNNEKVVFAFGDKFIDRINEPMNGQELACDILRYNKKTSMGFRRVRWNEVNNWLLAKYTAAYNERRIHLWKKQGRIEGDFEVGVFNMKGVPQSIRFFVAPDDDSKLIPIMYGFINVENTFHDLVYEPNWKKHLKPLSEQILAGEGWDYANTKNTQSEKYILRSYIIFAFYKAWLDDQIEVNEDYGAIFNTGLVNGNYQDIYCFLKNNTHDDDFFCHKWELVGFTTRSKSKLPILGKFKNYPKRTVYIGTNNIGDVYLDTAQTFDWNDNHIIGERLYRFPIAFLEKNLRRCDEAHEICKQIESGDADIADLQEYVNAAGQESEAAYEALRSAFDAAVEKALLFVEWDYRTCVTCYYARTNSISLVLPIRLEGNIDEKPELTLVIDRTPVGTYYGHTVLTLAMAYQDARQIGRPASDWLIPSYIESIEEDDEDADVEFDKRIESVEILKEPKIEDENGDEESELEEDEVDDNEENFADDDGGEEEDAD